MATFKFFNLSSDGSGKVKYNAPDGQAYILDPSQAGSGWHKVYDTNQKPVMAFRRGVSSTDFDGELVVSLDGAGSIMSTLLHNEDDYPRKCYYSSDGGNNNPLNRAAFSLRVDGEIQCPVQKWSHYVIMVVKP